MAATYRRARDLITRHGIFRMIKVVENGDGIKSVVICNLWRIDKHPSGAIETLEFLLTEERWVEVSTFDDYWPNIPFFPIHKTQTLGWWSNVAKCAVWKALVAVGYRDLPQQPVEVEWSEDYDEIWKPKPKEDLACHDMVPKKMADDLISTYIGKWTGYTKEGQWLTQSQSHDCWRSRLAGCDL
ncbi:hypothetical protein D5047_23800 (plasmid) [Verminephrobacter eiseniae]|nr:hypothetical protein [Verminephrobacter eiseniae]